MIDWIEELLALLVEPEEERSALRIEPVSWPGMPGEAASGGAAELRGAGRSAPEWAAAAERLLPEEWQAEVKRPDVGEVPAEVRASDGGALEELLRAAVRGGESWPAAERLAPSVAEGLTPSAVESLYAGQRDGGTRGGGTALSGLYRSAAAAAERWGGGAAGVYAPALRAAETEYSPGLTAAELDREVRRDSRRYDGGLSIY